MKSSLRSALLVLALGTAAPLPLLWAEPGHKFPPVTPAQIAGIEAALPSGKLVPAQPRKLLVFFRTEGFVHPCIPVNVLALKRLGESTGAFTTVESEDMAVFTPESLAGFDAIVFANTSKLQFADPAHRAALLAFVRNGRGLVGIHAAIDNFYTWPEGQALLGGVFHNHPWNAREVSAIKLDEPAHIINQPFKGKGFWLRDEIYQIVGPYNRDRQRVLLSLDMSKSQNARPSEKIIRTDNDFPISWIRPEGQGRVFYTSLGHREDVFFVPSVLAHMLSGIRFALGDLAADAVPSTQAPAVIPALAPENSTPLQELLVSPDLAALRALAPAERPTRQAALLLLLASPSASSGQKFAALDALSLAGTAGCVPAVALAAADPVPGIAERAIRILAQLRDPAAETALLTLSASLPDGARSTVIDALRAYPSAKTITRLKAIASDVTAKDAPVSIATLAAIATPESLTALLALPASETTTAAVIATASSLISRDPRSKPAASAAKVLRKKLPALTTPSRQVEALNALALMGATADNKIFLQFLTHPAARVRQAAVVVLVARRTPATLQALATQWPKLARDVQLAALADVRDASGAPFIKLGLAATDPAIIAAAFAAVSRSGDTETLMSLLPRLTETGALRDAAYLALAGSTSADLSARLFAVTPSSPDPALQASLLSLLGDRQVRAALPLIQALTADPADITRAAAFKALSLLAQPTDLPLVISLVGNIKKSPDRRDWSKALANATDGHPSPNLAAGLLATTLADPTLKERNPVIAALTLLDAPEAVATLDKLLAAPEAADRKDAIRALSSARSTRALILLQKTAGAALANDERILAVRGCIETISSLEDVRTSGRVTRYRQLWPLASHPEEKDAIIAAVRQLVSKWEKSPDAFLKEFAPEPAEVAKAPDKA